MGTEAPPAAPPTGMKMTQTDFDALLLKSGEAGARSYAALMQAEAAARAKMKDGEEEETKGGKDKVEMSAGALTGVTGALDNIGRLGIPFGSVLVGAIPGVVVGEVLDGVISPRNAQGGVNWLNPAAKVGAAWVGIQYGRDLLGSTGAMFFAGSLALQAMIQILPLDRIVAQMVGAIRRVTPTPTADAAQAYLGQAFNPRSARGGMWA